MEFPDIVHDSFWSQQKELKIIQLFFLKTCLI